MSTATNVFEKDPDSVLDYSIDWSLWLADGVEVDMSSWVIEENTDASPLSINSDQNTASATTVYLSGGKAGEDYCVINTIETSVGTTQEQTLIIRIEEK